MLLAQALADRHLRREQMTEPVYAVLEPYLERLQSLRAMWALSADSPPADEEET